MKEREMKNYTTKEEEWAEHFWNIAEVVKNRSKDLSTKIGGVVVGPGKEILSTGYNSFPRGIDDANPERQERPEKYYWMVHAERNCVYNAARTGTSLVGATMYLTCGIPCADCMHAVINSGIKEIWVTELLPKPDPNKPWMESCSRSVEMAKEAGIIINIYER